MTYYNLKLAMRNIVRHKLSSVISIFGLAVGFAAFLLISLFLDFEYRWDQHHEKYEQIYRVQRRITTDADVSPSANPILKELLISRYPEIEQMMLMHLASDEDRSIGEFLSSGPTRTFNEFEGIYADQSLFGIFTYHFLLGSQERALEEPFSIVLSRSLAEKLFPNEEAYGKLVILNKKINLKVTGVYEDLPFNSELRPSYIISLPTISSSKGIVDYEKSWRGDFYVYVLLKEGSDYRQLNEKIRHITKEFNQDDNARIYLHPLSQLYIQPNEGNVYRVALMIFRFISIFILLIVSFNYINLNTAGSVLRAKEIAVQKVNGSGKDKIIMQFLGESVIISLFSFVLAMFMTELLLPSFNHIVESELRIDYLRDWLFIVKNLGIAVMVGLLSGVYPALVMSNYKAVDLFRNFGFNGRGEGQFLKKVLVSLQFVICISLIILSLSMSRQVNYMITKDLGFDKENVLITNFQVSRSNVDFEYLKNRLLSHPEITSVCYADKFPFGGNSGWAKNWEGGDPLEKENDNFYWVSAEFIQTMRMELLMGRDFSPMFPADSGKSVIINETAMRRYGWADPIGKKVDDGKYTVIGVVKDFHPYGLYSLIRNCMMTLDPTPMRGSQAFAFRFRPGQMKEARMVIAKELEACFPNDAFELSSYADFIGQNKGYKKFASINHTISLFTILNILLAVMGLLGLVAFTTRQKSKEIALRKIHGCSITGILLILNRQYLGLILLASAVAWPVAWWVNLQTPIAYKCKDDLSIYLVATVSLLLICFITSLNYTVRAALQNPVEALRYE